MGTWQKLEKNIIALAESIWSTNAVAEDINGVKCDCVLKYRPDYWILIEVSKEKKLGKLRNDLAKFSSIKFFLISKQIYAESYFITEEIHKSLIETGKGNNVEVHSVDSFISKFLGSTQYINERIQYPFGSAVDPDEGKVDKTRYVQIAYEDSTGRKWDVQTICDALLKGRKIIITGEFGTGKSRCLMEVFVRLSLNKTYYMPIAINLRDNWGYKKFNHIIHNHMDGLGLGKFKDNLTRSIQKGRHPILLDGFDEIGSQAWGGDAGRLSEIRKGSLQGVRDLVDKCSGSGILITGREHYFNSNKEMLECLGLKEEETVILTCPDEFTEPELEQYISERTGLKIFPTWLPKKPLLCQLLTRIESDKLEDIVQRETGEIDFFENVFDLLCEREAKIQPTIYKESLKEILTELATLSREKHQNVGPISPFEINKVFEKVTGSSPIDESAIVLQRLPYLGRSGSDSADRVFIDPYAVDGLRAISLVKYYYTKNLDIKYSKWKHELKDFGSKILGEKIPLNDESIGYFIQLERYGNVIACCDYISAVLLYSDEVDFKKLNIADGLFNKLNFINKNIKNLTITDSYANELVLENLIYENLTLKNCMFSNVIGISNQSAFPECFSYCEADNYEDVLTVSRISELRIDDKHKTLLSILKKLFFQPGSGRKEEALLRGTERYWDVNAAKKIISFMQTEGMVEKFKGKDGWVYAPTRAHTSRAKLIMNELSNSKDPLWSSV